MVLEVGTHRMGFAFRVEVVGEVLPRHSWLSRRRYMAAREERWRLALNMLSRMPLGMAAPLRSRIRAVVYRAKRRPSSYAGAGGRMRTVVMEQAFGSGGGPIPRVAGTSRGADGQSSGTSAALELDLAKRASPVCGPPSFRTPGGCGELVISRHSAFRALRGRGHRSRIPVIGEVELAHRLLRDRQDDGRFWR